MTVRKAWQSKKPKFCSICTKAIDDLVINGEIAWSDGHNAEPVKNGRCCSECNDNVVIPARLAQFGIIKGRD